MADTCSNCKFWHHWREILCAADEPKSLGHCVVERHIDENVTQTFVQGLTAEDFYCGQHQPIQPQHSKQERADG